MARPLRLHVPGMVYHVMSRGNAKQDIFLDDDDRAHFIERLENATGRFGVRCPGYCLMHNHVHLILQPQDHPISRVMQQLNSSYCQWFNRRHRRVGHVLQGRFKSVMVESPISFLRLLRYVLRNPVVERYVRNVADWPWSSYRTTVGLAKAPIFLDLVRVWRALDAENASEAREQLAIFLADASDDHVWQECLALGSQAFLKRLEPALRPHQDNVDFAYKERFAARPSLGDLLSGASTEEERVAAMRRAFLEFAYTLKEIGVCLGRPVGTVWSQIHRNPESRLSDARGE